ncbi:Hypothetical predicted protein [Cloeon dipterum]|uniref:Uncharacterized protein n=1 Tax=Cloeon dipterum TaxID=197152 RepID=A0A8S1CTL1_9INSE|nr:Hypothetical predicted protein [Cloeon dipterum]
MPCSCNYYKSKLVFFAACILKLVLINCVCLYTCHLLNIAPQQDEQFDNGGSLVLFFAYLTYLILVTTLIESVVNIVLPTECSCYRGVPRLEYPAEFLAQLQALGANDSMSPHARRLG